METTSFTVVYDSFFNRVTDSMYIDTDMTEVEVSKKAQFAKGDILYICYMHMSATFDVISVLPNCIDDELVHLCLKPVLVEGEVKKYAAHS